MNKDSIIVALNNLADEKRLKRSDYDSMRNAKNSVLKKIKKSAPDGAKIVENYTTGSYKFLTGVNYSTNEYDIDTIIVIESDTIRSPSDATAAQVVKEEIIKKLRIELEEEVGKEIVKDKKPVINVTYKTNTNDDKFHLDFALMFKMSGRVFHLNRNDDNTYSLNASQMSDMTKKYEEKYNGDEVRRYASVLMKYWNHNVTQDLKKNVRIPSIAFSQIHTSLECLNSLDYIIKTIEILLSNKIGNKIELNTDFTPIVDIFRKQDSDEASKMINNIIELKNGISDAIASTNVHDGIQILKKFFKGIKVPREDGIDENQKPGRAG